MVDFEALLKKPPMSEEDRQKLWDDWYNGLSESERKIIDKEMKRIGEQRMSELHSHCQCDQCTGEDCGQDNPEEYEKERERDLADIVQSELNKMLGEVPIKAFKSVISLGYSFPQLLAAIIKHCRERAEECPDDETYTDSEMDTLVEWIEEEYPADKGW